MAIIRTKPENILTSQDPGLTPIRIIEDRKVLEEINYNPANPLSLPSNYTVNQVTTVVNNIIQNNPPTGANGQVQINENGQFVGDGGLTYEPTTDTLTTGTLDVGNIHVTGVANLGNVETLVILGGSPGEVLTTDGTGLVHWDTPYPSIAGKNGKFLVTDGINVNWSNIAYSSFATTTDVSNAIGNLINSAPTALDTLGELANALGNSGDFTISVVNQLANKVNTSALALVATSGNFSDLNYKPNLNTYLPTQTSNSGKYLTTNGTSASWGTVTIPTDIANLSDSTNLLGGAGGNPFDQDLNTTDDVTFANITLTGKVIAKQDTGTNGGYSFGGDEGGNDTGMFSESDGVLDLYSNNEKIVTITTDSVELTRNITSDGLEIYTNSGSGGSIDIYTDWTGTGTSGGIDLWLTHDEALYIKTNDGDFVWTFDKTGNLQLPVGGDILDSTGASVLGGGGASALTGLTDVTVTSPTNGQVLKYDTATSKWVNAADSTGAGGSGIALTDISVGADNSASGGGDISYNNTTGVFTYTPPDLSGYLTSVPTTLDNSSAGDMDVMVYDGNIKYTSNVTIDVSSGNLKAKLFIGNLTLPAGGDILDSTGTSVLGGAGGIALTDISVGTPNLASGGGDLSYNNSTGEFTYTPPDLSSYVTSITNIFDQDLNTSNNVTFANLEVNGKIEQNLTYTKGRNYLGISSGTTSDIWTADSDTITSVKLTVQIESRTGSPYYENFDTMTCEIVMAKKRNGGTWVSAPIVVYGIVHTSDDPLATFSSRIDGVTGQAIVTCTPDASITTTSYVRVHSVEMFSPSVQDDF